MKKRQLLYLPLIAILLVSLASNQFASSTASAEAKSSDEEYEIYPTPHSLEYNEGELSLNNEFQVIYDDTIDDVTKNKVTKIFEDNDLSTPEITTEPSDDKVTIFVGTNDSNGSAAQHADIDNDMNFDKTDAHLLEIENESITVIGKDTDAAFYGLVSLDAILNQSNSNTIQNLTIKDYANTEVRGFIEGFYGIPWSNDDRKSLMEFGGQFKTTSYIFAPKDDPYHRAKWDEPYPEDKLDEISDMAEVGRKNKTHFVWSISPLGEVAEIAQKEGDDAAMELLEENTEKMLTKFEQLYDAGVRQFGVLGDDVGALPLDYVVELMDSVSEWADEKGDIRDTIYTPAAYNSGWAWDGGKELNKLEKYFADNIHILWTGESTVGPVEQYTIDRFKHRDNNGVERRDPLFWLNWPVNDVDMTRVFLGKGDMLEPGIKNLAGVVTNPMQEAEASKISIFAIADYAWNTETFDASQSWEDSMKYIEIDATEEFYTLAKHMAHADPAVGMPADESENIKDLMDEIISNLDNDKAIGVIAPELMDELQIIADAGDKFMEKSKNKKLREELEPFINALRDMVLANKQFLQAELAIEDGDKEKAWNMITKASSLRKQSLNYNRPMLKGEGNVKAKPAGKRLQPFTDELQEKVTQNMEKLLDMSSTVSDAKVFTNVDDYKNLSINEKIDITSIDETLSMKLDRNDYIGLKLSRIKDLSMIEATMTEGLILETSLNGIEWEEVDDSKNPADARYVRLVNKTTKPISFLFDTFKVQSNEVEPISVVDKNVDLHESEALNVLDGELATYTWFAESQQEGQFITYNLGQTIDLDSLKVYVDQNDQDYPRHAVIETSLDGNEWHTAMALGNQDGPNEGEVTDDDCIEDVFTKDEGDYRSEEVSDINQEAKYLRFRVTRTKEGTGNWLRMHEIEINGGEYFPEINDPTITTTADVNKGNNVEKISDGKLDTIFKPANNDAGEILFHVGEAKKDIDGITLLEDPLNVSHSKLSVRTLQGWKEIGTTESGYNYFDLTDIDTVLDVKIEWENGNIPFIYQVTIDKVNDFGNVESTIQGIKSLVDHYADEGNVDGSAVRLLQTHLTSIDHFVKTESYSKAVNHMKGMKQLVNKYQEDGQMDKKAAKTLIRHADILIEKWQ
ncbi:beta-N-acetylglucosaminidase domain-containing protein [Virgibacillus sp. MSJ-26]|uniref:beta-N-acetylglucosaminidase domain-containing protein n=1 Tax=Virgibacillus sp. MSJ-26 TaxID=2841522 RepID=UPI001C102A3E|nr:beta-N-acetylglucosaminidase domain-containing protein [Virgibacillus sp. MSJ-26]MBU5468214.1 beta-N-acetylglucosaminidase domain-containing protein [Virgibacillus sp. MSJ-26]